MTSRAARPAALAACLVSLLGSTPASTRATLLATCFVGHLVRKEQVERAVRLDRVIGACMTASYAGLVLLLILAR